MMQNNTKEMSGSSRHNLLAEFLNSTNGKTKSNSIEVPSISLPKGGGAIKSIDEKFSVNAANGTAGFSIPLPVSEARGFSPELSISYDSGNGNGIFGIGWSLSLPSIKRKTDKKLPEYRDDEDSDIFVISGADDLVPAFAKTDSGSLLRHDGNYVVDETDRNISGINYRIRSYHPRIESSFTRIERWTNHLTGEMHWRTISKTNVTTLFGKNPVARIADPSDPKKIYQWLIEFSYDDKGRCYYYQYKKENDQGLNLLLNHNKNRKFADIRYTNLYLKRVLYGNRLPYYNGIDLPLHTTDYFFETVFDYGEHDPVHPPHAELREWSFRSDAFSDYRAGFEIRTTRLCSRVLLYHHFAELPGGSAIVRALDIEYGNNGSGAFTFLTGITSTGYIKKTDESYSRKSFPPVNFEYQRHDWNQEIKTLSAESTLHAPAGINKPLYQFVDLFSEGLPGMLTEQGNGWFYKENLGGGNFTAAQVISPKPSFIGLNRNLQLVDLDANGTRQVVQLNEEPKGFFELTSEEEWQPFRSFETTPNEDNTGASRLVDLTGDGLADILIAESNALSWYPSKGKKGFEPARKIYQYHDDEQSPNVNFDHDEHNIFLADMSGDGLVDILRIRNNEVCYWPNLGFGKFGPKITMDNVPVFDHPDQFNAEHIRISDLDGSGTADIVYLGKNKFSIYLNRQGNSLADQTTIDPFPGINNAVNIDIADLLGTGLSCIVCNNPLPGDQPIKYIDLFSSRKPHVLTGYRNNMGKEVSLRYEPSTKFYIEDKLAGRPWITKLHFPVHCVTRVESRDRITGLCLTSSYKFHHGYFDHEEREFRGFGMVEQLDTETFEHWEKSGATNITERDLHEPPVLTRTWFHTGAYFEKEKILNQFAHEYWYEEMRRQGFTISHHERSLPDARLIVSEGMDPALIESLSIEEWRQAFRACKGMTIRTETFALDAPSGGASPGDLRKQLLPYSVATHNCLIEILQPKGANSFAVFTVKESESIEYHSERDESDPRIAHQLNIRFNRWGNLLESASVVYPRISTDTSLPGVVQQAQAAIHITYSKNYFTNDVIEADQWRMRMPTSAISWELRNIPKSGSLYSIGDFENHFHAARIIPYEQHDLDTGSPQKRMIEHHQSIYLANDLVTPLAPGELQSLALPSEKFQLAYTPGLLANIFGTRVTEELMIGGKFSRPHAGETGWWVRSGTLQYLSRSETVDDARRRFYLPLSYTDPYGTRTTVKYYSGYHLFIEGTEDELHNKSSVELFNFYTLSPQRMKDPNQNISEVIFDELGLVKATAVFGKGDEADDLSGLMDFTSEEERSQVRALFAATSSMDLTRIAKDLLQQATSRFVYDLYSYVDSQKPVVVGSIRREEHFKINPASAVQIGFEYTGGMGQVVMKKQQAEPGLAKFVVISGDHYTITEVDTSEMMPQQLRWIGNGRTVFNNKGKPVKQYEPYFSTTHQYENLKELVETGVTPVFYYDPAGRLIKTVFPDGTCSRMIIDSWQQSFYDQNDLAATTSWYENRVRRRIDPELIADEKDPAKEAISAEKSAAHRDTPLTQHFDSLGRPVLSVDHNGTDTSGNEILYRTTVEMDIEGNLRSITDARGNLVMEYKYDMLGNKSFQQSMDAGRRWLLTNILGNPLRTWDDRNHEFGYYYDILHRPLHSIVTGGAGEPLLHHIFDRKVYGETEAEPERKNLRGKVVRQYDTGGLIDTPEYDFKGQPLSVTRKLFRHYRSIANWRDENLLNDVEDDPFTITTSTDAIGRIVRQTTPDGSIVIPFYNQTGQLKTESVIHPGTTTPKIYISDIHYDEKGQRTRIVYGNGVMTEYKYDRKTFRLNSFTSTRANGSRLQELHYTYDAVGNITHVQDSTIATKFYNNMRIEPANEYSYDPVYRLIEATGRENNSILSFDHDNWNDAAYIHSMSQGDGMNIRNYHQYYSYDSVGNILELRHNAGADGSWTRSYEYESSNNRLHRTTVGQGSNSFEFFYPHHLQHGYMMALPHLAELGWNFKEELVKSIRQRRLSGTPETTYYQYDGGGQRLRKITETESDTDRTTIKEQRIYISGYELYKKQSGRNAGLQRVTLGLMDKSHRFVLIETRFEIDDGTQQQLTRYQLDNHLGSCSLELDDAATVISYEEYHPFGTTAYQAKNNRIRSAAKRYRYTGMERDEETGLGYHSARYYLPWLGRWLSCDPKNLVDGVNVYAYSINNPAMFADPSGTQVIPRRANPNGFDPTLALLVAGDPMTRWRVHATMRAAVIADDQRREEEGRQAEINRIDAQNRDVMLSNGLTVQQYEVSHYETAAGHQRWTSQHSNIFSSLLSNSAANVTSYFTNDPQRINAAGDLGAMGGNLLNLHGMARLQGAAVATPPPAYRPPIRNMNDPNMIFHGENNANGHGVFYAEDLPGLFPVASRIGQLTGVRPQPIGPTRPFERPSASMPMSGLQSIDLIAHGLQIWRDAGAVGVSLGTYGTVNSTQLANFLYNVMGFRGQYIRLIACAGGLHIEGRILAQELQSTLSNRLPSISVTAPTGQVHFRAPQMFRVNPGLGAPIGPGGRVLHWVTWGPLSF
jgi:RHS repeat-associated protein